MKVIRILVFIGFSLFCGLQQGKGNIVEKGNKCLTENRAEKVKDSVEIPDLFFAGNPVEAEKLEKFNARLNKLYLNLKKRKDKYKDQEAFYKYFFYLVHSKILKDFENETSFPDLVKKGAYNCLTASLLYSHLLNALAIEHEILEYPYHVNILITEGGKRILLETTDPLDGYIEKAEEIEKNFSHHKSGGGKEIVLPSVANSCRKATFEELTGLLFFNKAVYLINKGNFTGAHLAVKQAKELYPSGRLDDLENYIASLW